MDKRGQFYLILAVIISLALYGVTYKVNSIEEPILWEDFNDVSKNYITESTFVANAAIKNHEQVEDRLDTFTRNFLDYAQERNPKLTLLYVYSNGTNVSVKSYLNATGAVNEHLIFGANQELVQDITIKIGGKEFIYKVPVTSENFGEGWNGVTVGNQPFNLSVGGIIHPFSLDPTGPEFRVIIRTESGAEEEVVLGDPGEGYPFLSPGNAQQFIG